MEQKSQVLRIKTVRKVLGFKNRDDFAVSLDIPFSTLRAYEQGKIEHIPLSFFKKIHEIHGISLEWLLSGKGDIMDNSSIDHDNPLSEIFYRALEISSNNDSSEKLKLLLENFIDTESSLNIIRPKLKSLKGYDLFSTIAEMWHGKGERMSIVFMEFIDNLTDTLSKNLSHENAKNDLLLSLDGFHKPLLKQVQGLSFSWENDKNNLKEWIEKNLDNLDCYIILSNLQTIKDSLHKQLNILNKSFR
jgi:transcriptional regulator with XRE-family HTH domain